MSNVQTMRSELEWLHQTRHYHNEQAWDSMYLEALNKLKRAEAEEHSRKADYHSRMANRLLREIPEEFNG